MRTFSDVARDQAGQTMAEYAVTLTVITPAVVAMLGLLSSTVTQSLNDAISLL
jgi:Flp pilus assembly pilin Flp